jgi:hypothetical protein
MTNYSSYFERVCEVTEISKILIIQRLIALPFVVLGAWCLLCPNMVENLGIRPEHFHGTAVTALLIGCFGAQAILSGLFAAFSRFTRNTFLIYGLALLPFFWFNYWFVFVVPIFTKWMALDFFANVFMLVLCYIGYKASPQSP